LRNGWSAYGQRASQLIDRNRASRELLKDSHPGCVAKCVEAGL